MSRISLVTLDHTSPVARPYVQAFIQSMVTFWLGIALAIAAVGGLFTAVLIVGTPPIYMQTVVIVLLAASTVVGLMSVLSLIQSNRAHAAAERILDRLREQRSYEVALAIADPELRDKTLAAISLRLVNVPSVESTLRLISYKPSQNPCHRIGRSKFVIRG